MIFFFSFFDRKSERSGKSVVILRKERDEAGNEFLVNLVNDEGKKAITNDEGDVVGYKDNLDLNS